MLGLKDAGVIQASKEEIFLFFKRKNEKDSVPELGDQDPYSQQRFILFKHTVAGP